MKIYEERFFCAAIDGTTWKVIVHDTRSSQNAITVSVCIKGKQSIQQEFFGTRALLMAANSTLGVAGYRLTDEGRQELSNSLVRIFLS